MKKALIIFGLVVALGVGTYALVDQGAIGKLSDEECAKYAGSHSFAWSPNIFECEEVGCKIGTKTYWEVDPYTADGGGYDYTCVAK